MNTNKAVVATTMMRAGESSSGEDWVATNISGDSYEDKDKDQRL
jgi:hypothetical protein